MKFKDLLFGKTEKPSIQTVNTLSPEQQALMGQLSTQLSDRLGRTSPNAGRAALQGIAGEGDVGLMATPEEEAAYQAAVVDPTLRTYKRDILSGAVNELGASGNISSSARERVLLGSAERLQDQLAQQRLAYLQGNQAQKLQSKQVRLSAAQALAQAEGQPDEQERYTSYVMNLLGIPTMGYVGFQGQQTPGLMQELAKGAGAAVGSMLAGG